MAPPPGRGEHPWRGEYPLARINFAGRGFAARFRKDAGELRQLDPRLAGALRQRDPPAPPVDDEIRYFNSERAITRRWI